MSAHKERRARRVKLRDKRGNTRPGVYYRQLAGGRRRYEITYLDSQGYRRWQTIDGGLDLAEATLEELRCRVRRGERVSPTTATFAEVGETWLASQSQLRPRTIQAYRTHLRLHVNPRIGRLRISDVSEDDLAALVAAMQADGKAAWTIRSTLTPLGRVLGYAARRGMIASNPLHRLERGERPTVEQRELAVLDRAQIRRLLNAAPPSYRPLLATAVFTGLRQNELLGVRWADVDFDTGLIRVRRALDRAGNPGRPKTPRAIRDVTMFPALARLLRLHRAASRFAREEHYVFSTRAGTPVHWRNASKRGLERALQGAGLGHWWTDEQHKRRWKGACRFHDLRHTYASLLIAQGENVVYVSRQLGHASPDITLRVYAHLFDQAEHAQRARDRLEASFGQLLQGDATAADAPVVELPRREAT